MKHSYLTMLGLLGTFVGCSEPAPQSPPQNRGVRIQAPGVDIKIDKEGANIQAPGTAVKIDQQGAEIKSPRAEIKVDAQGVDVQVPGKDENKED